MNQRMRNSWHDAITTVVVLVVAGVLIGAPLPKPKPIVRPPIVGTTWVMVHDTSTYWGRFFADGRYESGPQGREAVSWAGTWRMDGETLVVQERYANAAGRPIEGSAMLTWTAELEPGRWEGIYCDSTGRTGAFRLEK